MPQSTNNIDHKPKAKANNLSHLKLKTSYSTETTANLPDRATRRHGLSSKAYGFGVRRRPGLGTGLKSLVLEGGLGFR